MNRPLCADSPSSPYPLQKDPPVQERHSSLVLVAQRGREGEGGSREGGGNDSIYFIVAGILIISKLQSLLVTWKYSSLNSK
jgi:hypothetical protein